MKISLGELYNFVNGCSKCKDDLFADLMCTEVKHAGMLVLIKDYSEEDDSDYEFAWQEESLVVHLYDTLVMLREKFSETEDICKQYFIACKIEELESIIVECDNEILDKARKFVELNFYKS